MLLHRWVSLLSFAILSVVITHIFFVSVGLWFLLFGCVCVCLQVARGVSFAVVVSLRIFSNTFAEKFFVCARISALYVFLYVFVVFT